MRIEQRPDGRWQAWVSSSTRLDSFELRRHAEIELAVYSEWWRNHTDRDDDRWFRERMLIWEEIVKIMKVMGKKV